MKILFVTHYAEMMGANRSLLGLMRGLKKHGVESIVLCPQKGTFTEALATAKISYHVVPFTNWVYTKVSINYYLFPLRILQNYLRMPRLIRVVKAINPDLIYTNSSVTAVGAYLAHHLGKKHVWHVREFVRKHYKTNYVFGQKNFLKWMNRSAAVVSISQALLDTVLKDVTADKYLIYNGVMSENEIKHLSKPTAKSIENTETFTFLNVGLIHPMKQQLQALHAFHILSKKYTNIRLVFIGKGRRIYTRKMQNYIRKHQLEAQVEMMGYVPNPHQMYQQADALLMCSLHEGMGRVTAEAMAHGLPVIGLRSGATPELVQHGKNGYLYEGDTAQLAEQMEALILTPKLAREMGKKGYEMAKTMFTNERYVQQIFELIEGINHDGS